MRFPALPNQRWASPDGTSVREIRGFVAVDTDGDRVTDTSLPGTSNFVAGFVGKPGRNGRVNLVSEKALYQPRTIPEDTSCHPDECGVHCTSGVYPQ